MNLSIVIPLFNEQESLPELHDWIVRVLDQHKITYEIIFVDDGSRDDSWKTIETLASKNEHVKALRFQRNYGKSPALHVGFDLAKGDVVITMDADLQDSPEEIPELRSMIIEDGYDIVSGWKKKRYDNALTKNIPSKFYNATTRWMSGIKLHDFNCGLKAYRKNVVKSIEVYGEMHRYTPVLAKWAGFKKIGEKVVTHQARKYGVSKFGISRFVNGPLDLASIMFVGKYGKRPMHFFGLLGSIFFIIGIGLSIFLIIKKFIDPESTLTDKPGFYIALTTTIIGVQLFLSGFIGELISRNAPGRNSYLIEKKAGI